MDAASPHVLLKCDPAGGDVTVGYVHACGRDFAIRVVGAARAPDRRLDVCAELEALLRGSEAIVARRLAQSCDAAAFAVELAELLERLPAHAATPASAGRAAAAAALPTATYYARLIGELDAIGWELVADLSADLSVVELSVPDDAGRLHACEVRLPPDYPRSPPVARCALPGGPLAVDWPAARADAPAGARFELSVLLAQLRAELARYQETWEMLDDIDAHTAVLEPHAPTRDACARRVAFGRHSSLQLRLNPRAARALPEVVFFGAEAVVAPLRARLNERLAHWDAGARTVRENLELVLETEFPKPTAANADEFTVECGICYAYRLDGVIPANACDGCSQVFHHGCLLEWLQALPNCQQSFDSVFGSCPYCSKPISTKLHAR
jgi:E3 ubiquitin-protein ligase FANCL